MSLLGQSVTLYTYTFSSGTTLGDPTSLTCELTDPAGVKHIRVWPSKDEIHRSMAGVFDYGFNPQDLSSDPVGTWAYTWSAEGAIPSDVGSSFVVLQIEKVVMTLVGSDGEPLVGSWTQVSPSEDPSTIASSGITDENGQVTHTLIAGSYSVMSGYGVSKGSVYPNIPIIVVQDTGGKVSQTITVIATDT